MLEKISRELLSSAAIWKYRYKISWKYWNWEENLLLEYTDQIFDYFFLLSVSWTIT